jgi:hypothetical protein
MVQLASALAVGVLGLASIVSAHPGHDHKAEAAERALYMRNAPIQSRSLSQCASQMKARGLESRNVARRAAAVKHLRRRRGLKSGTPHVLNFAQKFELTFARRKLPQGS